MRRLFVYGTLMPGRLRWPQLEPYAVTTRPAGVPGALYDSGNGWPVAVFGSGDGVVPGVIVELDPDRVDQALVILDDIENTATDMLRRIVVTTTEDEQAWAYDWPHDVASMTRIDRWDEQEDH